MCAQKSMKTSVVDAKRAVWGEEIREVGSAQRVQGPGSHNSKFGF